MKALTTKPFDKDYQSLPRTIQELTNRKLLLLLQNPRHPSLRLKKMEDPRDIWEARVTRNYRITFQVKGDTIILRRIGTHDILKTP